MASVATLTKLSQADDPRKALVKQVGDLSNVEVMGNRVLLAIYIGSEVYKSGIDDAGKKFTLLRTTTQVKEDVYQGTVGLVLKLGPKAFKDEPETKTFFQGQSVKVGDWVVFRPGDAKRTQIREVDCRFVEDTLLDMVVSDPTIITHKG